VKDRHRQITDRRWRWNRVFIVFPLILAGLDLVVKYRSAGVEPFPEAYGTIFLCLSMASSSYALVRNEQVVVRRVSLTLAFAFLVAAWVSVLKHAAA
jgi:hypothetical protein